jgi:Zn-dependent protease
VAVFVGSGVASWHYGSSQLAVFGFVVAGWLVSLCLHEFSHALVAYMGGDRSVAVKGYLRLDIRRYANPAFSFVLPVLFVLLGGVGLPGGAVWIDHSALRSRHWRSLTSLAGPVANVICAAACMAPFALKGGPRLLADGHLAFWSAVAFLGFLQLWALLLNLLPVPGLDGWGVIEPYLPPNVVETGRKVSPLGFMVVFFLAFSSPTVSGHLTSLLTSVQAHFGVPTGLASWGYHLMKFWSKN